MSDQRVFRNPEEVIGKVLDGEAIIINLVTGAYYSATGAGAVIWNEIEQGRTMSGIADAIASRYDVDAGTAAQDVERIIGEMAAEKLVRIEDADGSALSATEAPRAPAPDGSRAPYEPPVFTVYQDMRDLLALDPPMPVFGNTPRSWDPEPGH